MNLGHSILEREVLPHLGAVTSFAQKLCADEQRAKDLVQETMLKAFRYQHTYREGTNCRAWLFQICKNSFINDFRRKRYEPIAIDFQEFEHTHTADSDATEDDGLGYPCSHDPLLEMTSSIGDEVDGALRSIPPEFQTAIILCDVEGYTYDEIAQFMNVPIGTIRSRIHRGRKMLAVMLEGHAMNIRLVDSE